MRWVLVLLLVVAACAACNADPPAPPLTGPFVVLKLDGRTLAAVPISHAIPLTELVPTVPAWFLVEASAPDGRYLEVAEPAKTYPGAEIRLDRAHGHITIGVFNPAVKGAAPGVVALSAQPIITLSEVSEIDVLTRPRPAPPPVVGLQVVVEGQAHEIAPDDLEALTEPRPRCDRCRIAGRDLRSCPDHRRG
jgi:hypothetical protein